MDYVLAMKPPDDQPYQSPYMDLLHVIEEMDKDIWPTYAGSKTAMEWLKQGIIHAQVLTETCTINSSQ